MSEENKHEQASEHSTKDHNEHHAPTTHTAPSSSDTVTFSKEQLWKYSTFILAAILIVGAFATFNQGAPTARVVDNGAAPIPSPTPAPAGVPVAVNIDGAPVKGDANAEILIVEYSDYECPFCGRFYSDTLPQLQKEYVDTGIAKLVFKDFPLSFHPNAQKAAEAAHCVREELGDDGYYEMHDLVFENQGTLSDVNFKKWARELGADGTKFDSCLDTGKTASIVQAGFTEGQADGVRGTPAFFINGKLLSGAQPFSAFKQAIDAELA